MSLETVRSIALRVRRRIHRLVEGVDGIDGTDLEGACAIASYTLTEALKLAGFDATFVFGGYKTKETSYPSDHCWVRVVLNNREWCVDITATQFNRPEEVVIEPAAPHYVPEHFGDEALDVTHNWEEQAPAYHAAALKQYLRHLKRVLREPRMDRRPAAA